MAAALEADCTDVSASTASVSVVGAVNGQIVALTARISQKRTTNGSALTDNPNSATVRLDEDYIDLSGKNTGEGRRPSVGHSSA